METHEHKIMIVDDSVSVVRYLENIINRKIIGKFFVYTAFTAEEALVKAKENPPDLVLMDISLPQMSGLQACEVFTKLFPSLPVIVITAELSSENQKLAEKAGAADFIMKPFNADQILGLIYTHLKQL